MSEVDEGYIKEGDIILIDWKDDNTISEVKITDISPSGEYIEVRVDQYNEPFWVHSNRYLETLQPADADDSEYIDVAEIKQGSASAQDILAKIRNRNEAFDPDEKIKSEVIQIDRFAELDIRNQKK